MIVVLVATLFWGTKKSGGELFGFCYVLWTMAKVEIWQQKAMKMYDFIWLIPLQLGRSYDHHWSFWGKNALCLAFFSNVWNAFHSSDHQIHQILRKGTPSSQLQWLSWCYQPKFFTKMTRRVSRVWPSVEGMVHVKRMGCFSPSLLRFWDVHYF